MKRQQSTARSWASNVERSSVIDFTYHRGKPRGGGILVLDAGTSTIDFTLFAEGSDRALVRMVEGRLDQLYADARFHAEDATGRTVTDIDCADESPPGHDIAVEFLFNWLEQHAGAVPVLAVGHHVLHGGSRFSGPAPIDGPTLRHLQALLPRAPARQRPSLVAIRVIARRWPKLPQVACFETAFYHLPALEDTLLSPVRKRGSHRYGYDGLWFESVVDALPAVNERAAHGKTIVVHVGGANLCALDDRRKVAMATGFGDLHASPGTRSRWLDLGVVSHLLAESGMDPSQARSSLRQWSERLGASGLTADLDRLMRSNEPGARVAIELLLYRISRELGSLAAALAGLDAIVFTAGAGPHAVPLRAEICRRASWLGVDLNPAANRAGGPRLTRPGSRVAAWVITTDPRLIVARHTQVVVAEFVRRERQIGSASSS